MRYTRAGLSLIELLIVIAILALLLALLLPAIQKARETALRFRSQNNVKQISQAVLTYTEAHDGHLPAVDADPMKSELNVHQAAITVLNSLTIGPRFDWVFPWNPIFLSPSDPSAVNYLLERNSSGLIEGRPTSYSANAQVFRRLSRYPFSISDGVSNTIFYCERYADCFFSPTDYHSEGVGFAWNGPDFVNRRDNQVYPILLPGQLSQPSRPGVTFQIRPVWRERPTDPAEIIALLRNPPDGYCDPTIPQTPHTAGMIVGVGDGSVRTVGRNTSPGIFWSLVTPTNGEIVNDW